jgi:hypothetical protein
MGEVVCDSCEEGYVYNTPDDGSQPCVGQSTSTFVSAISFLLQVIYINCNENLF